MYKQREIVLVPFPYSDLSSTKRRPVLIISNNLYNAAFPDILVCVITSNLYSDEYSVELSNDNLEVGMLPELSVIKCHKLFTIEQTRILKRFSIITEEKLDEVVGVLGRLVEKSE
jgi:mRNA interferase MazF